MYSCYPVSNFFVPKIPIEGRVFKRAKRGPTGAVGPAFQFRGGDTQTFIRALLWELTRMGV